MKSTNSTTINSYTTNYSHVQEMSHEERVKMYMKCPKQALAEMLANRDEMATIIYQRSIYTSPSPQTPPQCPPYYPHVTWDTPYCTSDSTSSTINTPQA